MDISTSGSLYWDLFCVCTPAPHAQKSFSLCKTALVQKQRSQVTRAVVSYLISEQVEGSYDAVGAQTKGERSSPLLGELPVSYTHLTLPTILLV